MLNTHLVFFNKVSYKKCSKFLTDAFSNICKQITQKIANFVKTSKVFTVKQFYIKVKKRFT